MNTVVEANEGKSPLTVGAAFAGVENFMSDTSHSNLKPIMLCHTITFLVWIELSGCIRRLQIMQQNHFGCIQVRTGHDLFPGC